MECGRCKGRVLAAYEQSSSGPWLVIRRTQNGCYHLVSICFSSHFLCVDSVITTFHLLAGWASHLHRHLSPTHKQIHSYIKDILTAEYRQRNSAFFSATYVYKLPTCVNSLYALHSGSSNEFRAPIWYLNFL